MVGFGGVVISGRVRVTDEVGTKHASMPDILYDTGGKSLNISNIYALDIIGLGKLQHTHCSIFSHQTNL